MKKPDYCTQNNGDCPACNLVNYGRDCQDNPVDYVAFAASAMGRSKSPAKTAAVRENGKKGGRPKVRGDGDCYALMMTNGRWSAIISNRAVAESFGECLLTASSRARLISKIEASEYAGYYQDGLIEGLNDGKRCERWSVRPV
jgi:hypothetical protein